VNKQKSIVSSITVPPMLYLFNMLSFYQIRWQYCCSKQYSTDYHQHINRKMRLAFQ